MSWLEMGNTVDNYGLGFTATNDSRLQAMNAAQLAAFERNQGDPRNMPLAEQYKLNAIRAMNAWRPPISKPTMTIIEWDKARAAFDLNRR